jgi:hypothetical protein
MTTRKALVSIMDFATWKAMECHPLRSGHYQSMEVQSLIAHFTLPHMAIHLTRCMTMLR